MNIKCSFCQMPYAIGRSEMASAIQQMHAEKLNHYDAHCPRCRRSTPVQRQRMELFMPNWRDVLKELEAEMIAHPQHAAPASPAETSAQTPGTPAPPSPADSKPAQKREAPAKPAARTAPVKTKPSKPSASKAKPAAKTSSPKGRKK